MDKKPIALKPIILKFLDNFESYICQALLAFFVCLLFIQILLREFFESLR